MYYVRKSTAKELHGAGIETHSQELSASPQTTPPWLHLFTASTSTIPHKSHDRILYISRVMRRCSVAENFSPTRLWGCRSLRTSPRSRPRAVKQLNNAELLKIVQDCKQDATPTSDPKPKSSDITVQTREELPQSFSQLSARSPPLPRSPLTEPRLVAARARHRAEKPPPSKERSPFQLKLERNPYGMINSCVLKDYHHQAKHTDSPSFVNSAPAMYPHRRETTQLLPYSLRSRKAPKDRSNLAPSQASKPHRSRPNTTFAYVLVTRVHYGFGAEDVHSHGIWHPPGRLPRCPRIYLKAH